MSEKIEIPVEEEESATLKKRMTPAMWSEAGVMWASGEYTLEELSEKFGVAKETLSRRFKRDKVKKGEDSVASLIKKSAVDSAATRAKERAERAEERRNQFDTWATSITKLVMKTVATCSKEGKPFATIEGDIKALQRAADAIGKSFLTVSKALQLDVTEIEDEELPTLVVGQLTSEQVQQYRKIQTQEDEQESDFDEDLEDEMQMDAIPIPSDEDHDNTIVE